MIQATPGKIVCKEIKEKDLYEGQIILAKVKKGKALMGIVTSCGDSFIKQYQKANGLWAERKFYCPVNIGDLVFFKSYGPKRNYIGGYFDGEEYLFAWFEDIIGYIKKGEFNVNNRNVQEQKKEMADQA